MPVFILQTALLMLAAYVLGAIGGCLIRQFFRTAFADDDTGLVRERAGNDSVPVIETSPIEPARSGDTLRFERALTRAPENVGQVETEPKTVPETISSSSNDNEQSNMSPVAVAAAAAAASAVVVAGSESEDREGAGAAVEAEIASPDDLERIYMVDGPTAALLNERGITKYAQIAEWTSKDVAEIENALNGSRRRVSRENWIEQARILASGGKTAFAKARDDGVPWDPNWHRSSHIRNGSYAAGAQSSTNVREEVVAAAPAQEADQLQRISGIDVRVENFLNDNGVHRFEQIANWTQADVTDIEVRIKEPGRVARESWIEQARWLCGAGAVSAATSSANLGEHPDNGPVLSRPELAGMRSVRSEALVGAGREGAASDNDLKRIRGIGVLIEKKLKALGVTSYEQVANWTRSDIDRISETLDFKGRIERENWVEQARILASGGQTDFSRRIDRGEI